MTVLGVRMTALDGRQEGRIRAMIGIGPSQLGGEAARDLFSRERRVYRRDSPYRPSTTTTLV